MTAREFASKLGAKKAGKDKWVALCPSHPDRHPSLSIGIGKKHPLVFKCESHGCSPGDILTALGLTWRDILGESSPEIKAQMSDQRYLENLEYRGGLAYMLSIVEPDKRNYWQAAYRRMRTEYRELWCQIYPVEAYKMLREKRLQEKINRLGLERMWETV